MVVQKHGGVGGGRAGAIGSLRGAGAPSSRGPGRGCAGRRWAAGGVPGTSQQHGGAGRRRGPGGRQWRAPPRDPGPAPRPAGDAPLRGRGGGEGGAAGRRGGGAGASKTCTYEGCRETTSQVAKQRKPWMCKKHRNKMYEDKYKKKSDQAPSGGAAGGGGGVKLEESADSILAIVKQRAGSFGDRPAKPTLLEQVLNQKRLSLLRSPEVVQFLQKQQQLLNQQVLEQRQQQFPGAPV
ncbi:regulatory factor X-associated protein-like [Choloepus didactylus]|uniref:regulatory factor X-associated protein-like n=1 Tax=Choloepus didactylus TaxID=27675 RepID=UPI00189C99B5|nr:regulatory factor X-associated protein-like [Choloepus didactylus]